MGAKKPTNPFYFALLPVGVVFALTACAFVVMTMRGRDPQHVEQTGLVGLMEHHGVMMMIVELVVLAVLTFAAIASDDFWVRRFEAVRQRQGKTKELS
jgi:uncharacterized membrane protein